MKLPIADQCVGVRRHKHRRSTRIASGVQAGVQPQLIGPPSIPDIPGLPPKLPCKIACDVGGLGPYCYDLCEVDPWKILTGL